MTDNSQKEEKIAELQAEEGVSKDSATKKVAEKTIQEMTGESAETNSNKVRDTLQIFDALVRGNLKEIIKEKKDIPSEDIKKLYEHMLKNPEILDELAHIGYGSDQLSVNAGMLKDRFDEVIKDIDINGEAQQQEKTIEENQKDNPTSKENNQQTDLFPPPIIPPLTKPNITDDLGKASQAGAILANELLNGIQNAENVVANTTGEIAGTVAQTGTEKVLGKNAVGKVGGKVAKEMTKGIVRSAVLNQLGGGGLGK